MTRVIMVCSSVGIVVAEQRIICPNFFSEEFVIEVEADIILTPVSYDVITHFCGVP
jgi:hypothetical protein